MVEKHYARHHTDYQQRPAAAITAALAEVRFAPHLHPRRGPGANGASLNTLKAMVDAAGIEPASPNMSATRLRLRHKIKTRA